MAQQPSGGGGAGYDISASSTATSGSKQTVAGENRFSVGALTFGTKQNNTPLYIIGGLIVAAFLFKKVF